VITRSDKRVLPPVITYETVAVIPAVELDDEVSLRVVEVGTPDELPGVVVQIRLHFGHR